MNVSPRSENLGHTVHIKGSAAETGVKLQKQKQPYEVSNDSDEEDEDFMALMNETKRKETQDAEPFRGNAGLPGGHQSVDSNAEFQLPTSGTFERPHESRSYEYPSETPGPSAGPASTNFRSLEEEKQHFLYKIQRLQNRFPGRRVSLDTPLDELKYEYDRLKRQSEMSASIKFQRRTLMATVSGIEYLNKSFNPLGLHLDGWSEQVMDSIEDFDQTFEQLHDKYQGTSEVSPEWNLMIMLLGSGFMFHLSNSLFKSVLPNVSDVAKNNPDLMNQIASAMGTAMNNGTQSPIPTSNTPSNSQLGARLAMQAMQQKLRPQDELTESGLDSEIQSDMPSGFEQAQSLRKPLPPLARPVPAGRIVEEFSESGGSDLSSEISMSEDGDVRKIVPGVKRPPADHKKSSRKKSSVNIKL